MKKGSNIERARARRWKYDKRLRDRLKMEVDRQDEHRKEFADYSKHDQFALVKASEDADYNWTIHGRINTYLQLKFLLNNSVFMLVVAVWAIVASGQRRLPATRLWPIYTKIILMEIEGEVQAVEGVDHGIGEVKQTTFKVKKEVRMKLVKFGHSQTTETRLKIGAGVRKRWDRLHRKKLVQETCYFEWENLIAEASRQGYAGEDKLQWNSCETLNEQLKQEWLEIVKQRNAVPKAKGNRSAPKSLEQRRKIAEAISTQWADPEYRERVCSALAKYHGTEVGAERKSRRPSDGTYSTRRNPVKKRFTDTTNSLGGETRILDKMRLKRSKFPVYKDPLASSKLEMIKNIRAQRAVTETKQTEAIERARLLIAEAEKAAKALEVRVHIHLAYLVKFPNGKETKCPTESDFHETEQGVVFSFSKKTRIAYTKHNSQLQFFLRTRGENEENSCAFSSMEIEEYYKQLVKNGMVIEVVESGILVKANLGTRCYFSQLEDKVNLLGGSNDRTSFFHKPTY